MIRRLSFPLVLGLVGTTILVALGVWQMQRLDWKLGILAEIDSRISAAPVALPDTPDPDRDKYLPVVAEGEILPGEIRLLVSLKRSGPGYRIVAPFATGGRRVMIDRGFAAEGDRDAARQLGPVRVTGNLHWPDEIDMFTPDPDATTGLWFARDVPAMAAALGTEPVLIVAATQTDPALRPLPVDTAGVPNDHLEYAITWFSLAVIWAVMSIALYWRNRPKANQTASE